MTSPQNEQQCIILRRLIQQEMIECWHHLAQAYRKSLFEGNRVAEQMYKAMQPEYTRLAYICHDAIAPENTSLFPIEWVLQLTN